jgi:hypothetical protein
MDVPEVKRTVGIEFPAVVHIVPPGGVPVFSSEYVHALGGKFRVTGLSGGGAGREQDQA